MNIEIIPNLHPIFVHFTVALLSISALFFFAGLILKNTTFLIVARWNLWVGGTITILTILAGFYAYGTVAHDELSHAAMTDHKNWALVTAFMFAVLTGWSLAKHRGAKTVSSGFVVLILLASGLLGVTGFKGGEVVYRHGTGVMRLPVISGDGGHDSHSHGGDAMEEMHSDPEANMEGNHDDSGEAHH